MPRQRFTGRYMGLGGRIIKAALKQQAVKMDIPPALRDKIKEATGCTDEDIDKIIRDGITDFQEASEKIMAEQHEQLTPPKEK